MKTGFFPMVHIANPSLQTDLQQLVSLVRERQSSLLMLLEQRRTKIWQRPEWLLKQCEYQEKESRLSREVRSVILRWVLFSTAQNQKQQQIKFLRGFWIKVKMVMKMSLERMKLLNLLSFPLFQRYQSIIDSMNSGYDRAAGICHYREIEEMIKHRNRLIHDMLNQSQKITKSFERNQSQYQVKQSVIQCPSDNKMRKISPFKKKRGILTSEQKDWRRPLSHHSIHKIGFNPQQFLVSRKFKKIQHLMQRYEHKLEGAMAGKIEINIDKKKTVEQNLDTMFDQLLSKNINNHKTIAKYVYRYSGKALKKMQTRKHLKILSKTNNAAETPKFNKKEAKKSKQLLSRQIEITQRNQRYSGLVSRRALSAKIKRRQINSNRQSQFLQSGIKLTKKRKCL